ncbi:DUF2163 domain-containing protein [Novosphingobium sp.]|uniref:DUF2163 domain-containing protein n=1 Tax=Novosphingobium sp. TaxID=1874826 RepID=UPI00262FA970|nr:DUF2163 domain-containing protein [Novosphingobium sp.]
MSRVWFATELETVATFWRLLRRDGVALGFVTHDRDLWLDGLCHRAAPGMVPSAIRRSAGLEADSAEVEGALAHDALSARDMACGRFDGAALQIGLVDWQSGESEVLYRGTLGGLAATDEHFQAVALSGKADLHRDPVPRTSPSCRAVFCGPECGLSAIAHDRRAGIAGCDMAANTVTIAGADSGSAGDWIGGRLRWLDGPLAGTASTILWADGPHLALAAPLEGPVPPGSRVVLRHGCDRTLATCADRFANAVNFRGEPTLPGNDFVARTPVGG